MRFLPTARPLAAVFVFWFLPKPFGSLRHCRLADLTRFAVDLA